MKRSQPPAITFTHEDVDAMGLAALKGTSSGPGRQRSHPTSRSDRATPGPPIEGIALPRVSPQRGSAALFVHRIDEQYMRATDEKAKSTGG
jgi:hypothetical protein